MVQGRGFLPGLAYAGRQSAMWNPLAQHCHWARAAEDTDSSQQKRRGKKRATASEFLRALELMWGKRFGGFTRNLGLSRSDLNPEVLLWGPSSSSRMHVQDAPRHMQDPSQMAGSASAGHCSLLAQGIPLSLPELVRSKGIDASALCHTRGSPGPPCPHLLCCELLPQHLYPLAPPTSALSGERIAW